MKKQLCAIILLCSMAGVNCIAQDTTSILTDSRDARTYKIVKIGEQWWMAENMQYKTLKGTWCYNNEDSTCVITGKYYNWEAALKACPRGWHLPADSDWRVLEKHLGMRDADLNKTLKRYSGYVGKKLMQGGGSGFNAIPTGYVYSSGKGNYGDAKSNFWSSDEHSSDKAWYRSVEKDIVEVTRYYGPKEFGYSVRCVMD